MDSTFPDSCLASPPLRDGEMTSIIAVLLWRRIRRQETPGRQGHRVRSPL
ncbi:Uncharacterized protein FKW44_008920 [Caligus rogercresseyi]|uniref:Uncharacterized protein n=1 Tax=Caligus rogercresseyi TaxID=217165 RepID=A0A7T8HEP4_CALRO|nr:Uncharacterized protein FKW44_008920 [Caligus rogercresseyi]